LICNRLLAMTIVERESFRVFTDVLEQTSKAKGSEAKLKIIEDFWKQVSRVSSFNADDCPSRMMEPFDSFSVLRLLLPELDDERRSFGMKEKGLAELYISVLELDSQSFDAQRLRRWQDPNLQVGFWKIERITDVLCSNKLVKYQQELEAFFQYLKQFYGIVVQIQVV